MFNLEQQIEENFNDVLNDIKSKLILIEYKEELEDIIKNLISLFIIDIPYYEEDGCCFTCSGRFAMSYFRLNKNDIEKIYLFRRQNTIEYHYTINKFLDQSMNFKTINKLENF